MELTHCLECGAPAEVLDRVDLESTNGSAEHVKTMCAGEARHILFFDAAKLAIGALTPDAPPQY
jgi:hypothetical protein